LTNGQHGAIIINGMTNGQFGGDNYETFWSIYSKVS